MNALPVLREMAHEVGSSMYETFRHPSVPPAETHFHRGAAREKKGLTDTAVTAGIVSLTTVTLASLGLDVQASPVVAYFCPTDAPIDLAGGAALMGASGRAVFNSVDGLFTALEVGLCRLFRVNPSTL